MVNYKMKFSVSDAAQILKVDKKTIKEWAYVFNEYMSPSASPATGIQKEFLVEDIHVLAYVSLYWEDQPDLEHIKYGLNSNSHYDNILIENLIIEITPLFIEPPKNIDETWSHGIVFSGISQYGDTYMLAKSYKLAGDRLVEIALKNEETLDLYAPAIFNYRHAVELYLKSYISNYKQSHDLLYLFSEFDKKLKLKFNAEIPKWFENIILVFNDFDPGGTTFRYGNGLEKDEVFVDFIQLKNLMNWFALSFESINKANNQF
jgi:hypothetical protein